MVRLTNQDSILRQAQDDSVRIMNIILIGMRGSGKSTVGKLLAERLGYGFKETDAILERRGGMDAGEYARKNGWDEFRRKEAEAVIEAVKGDRLVISTGGGVILSKRNTEQLKKNGFLVLLYAPLAILIARLKQETVSRPMLTDAATWEEDMARVWKEREPLYRAAADVVINTAQQSMPAVVAEIVNVLKERNIL
jgi:shikimate kinase